MRARDEAGQALVLALAFMLIVGLGIGALVSYAGANLLSTRNLRTQRSTVYSADGAINAAIQMVRKKRVQATFFM